MRFPHGTCGDARFSSVGVKSLPSNPQPRVLLDKRRQRAASDAAIGALSPGKRRAFDASICARLAELPEFGAAEQIFGYWALTDEASIEGLLNAACASGKAVFLPVVASERTLVFGRWKPGLSLKRGLRGTEEPTAVVAYDARASLTLVPGRAFDPKGRRLGRGGGYYDKALLELRAYGPLAGVAYGAQLVEAVPTEFHDVQMDMVVTEQTTYRR